MLLLGHSKPARLLRKTEPRISYQSDWSLVTGVQLMFMWSCDIQFTLWGIKLLKEHISFSIQVFLLYISHFYNWLFCTVWWKVKWLLRCCLALEISYNSLTLICWHSVWSEVCGYIIILFRHYVLWWQLLPSSKFCLQKYNLLLIGHRIIRKVQHWCWAIMSGTQSVFQFTLNQALCMLKLERNKPVNADTMNEEHWRCSAVFTSLKVEGIGQNWLKLKVHHLWALMFA